MGIYRELCTMSTLLIHSQKIFAPLIVLCLSYTSSAEATPTCTTATLSTLLSIPNMTVRHDAPIGSEIGTSVITSPIDAYSCTRGFSHQGFYVKGYGLAATQINGLNIYKLGSADSGIGYAVYGESVGTCPGFKPITGTSEIGGKDAQGLCQALTGTFPSQPIKGALKLVFYKIGNITPGKKPAQQVGSFALKNNNTSWVYPEPQVNSSAFTVNTVGCTVSIPAIDVPLGDVGMEKLESSGSTAAEQAFSIPINCDIGTKVKLTLKAGSAGVYDNTNGLLNLADPQSPHTAQGVKIQILSNDIPVTYETPMDMGIQQATGLFTIPLKARYYRSAESIRPGIANSSATYIITYE